MALAGIDALGSGMFIPVSVLFLTRSVGLPAVEVGLGLTVAGLCGLVATPLAGHVGDRHDARTVSAACYALCALGFAAYTLVHSFLTFVILASLIQMADRGASSTRSLVALSLAEGSERIRLLTYERVMRNVGYGLGGLCASLALLSGSRAAYVVILLANAISYGAGAILLGGFPPARSARTTDAKAGGYRQVLRDRIYLGLACLTGALWLNDSLLKVALPIWILRRTHAPPFMTGILFALNTVLVVVLQVRISNGMAALGRATRGYVVAGLALVVCCGSFAAASYVPLVAAVIFLTVAVTALSVGEMVISAVQWNISVGLLREELRGHYLGVFSTSIAGQAALGPAIVTLALVRAGSWGWLGIGGFLLLASLGAARLASHATTSSLSSCRAEGSYTGG